VRGEGAGALPEQCASWGGYCGVVRFGRRWFCGDSAVVLRWFCGDSAVILRVGWVEPRGGAAVEAPRSESRMSVRILPRHLLASTVLHRRPPRPASSCWT